MIPIFITLFSMEHGANCKGACCSGKAHCWIHCIVKTLVIVGGLNWGLIAINPDWNLVTLALGQWPVAVQVVYGLVGLAALKMLVYTVMKCCKKDSGCCGGQCKK